MLRLRSPLLSFGLCALVVVTACGPKGAAPLETETAKAVKTAERSTREPPPAPGEPKDVSLPPVDVTELDNGLQINTIVANELPVVYATLVVSSGAESDPPGLPGLAGLVASMLKEGTTRRTSAQLAEDVEFLGADLWASSDEENTYVGIRALAGQFDVAMSILAEVATEPALKPQELAKLKKRELDRLALAEREPGYIARRAFYRRLYGDHPYAAVDTTPAAVKRVTRQDMARWHGKYFVGKNAFLVVAGDVTPEQVAAAAKRDFAKWKPGRRVVPSYGEMPSRKDRQIIVVDRPGSVQSVIYIGNLAVPRANRVWIPLMVANQVLGGSAASRLFMDLREKRSLTYGAYSTVAQRVQTGPFIAYASVRTDVTNEAIGAFFEHLEAIVKKQPSPDELANAKRYLSDSFPLRVDTPGKLADLVVELRTFELPDDYWDRYRRAIRATSGSEALYAAREYIKPDKALVVIVGQAADFAESLTEFGPVTVVSPEGEVKAQFSPQPPSKPAEPSPKDAPAAPIH
ncbi:MAG: insulinase family protein [Myxococcales bacterium]|nr:insulinase family protein [Myxococcales bacterium]MDH3482732.1 insulinase family protein [Myxococcales bacterium]